MNIYSLEWILAINLLVGATVIGVGFFCQGECFIFSDLSLRSEPYCPSDGLIRVVVVGGGFATENFYFGNF